VSSFFLSFIFSVFSFQNVCILSSLMHAIFPSHPARLSLWKIGLRQLSGFHCCVVDVFAVLVSYAALFGNCFPTFRDSSTLEVGTDRLSRNVAK
jgi:hypothetical protein